MKQTAQAAPTKPGTLLDLHKSWHALHWLLCQEVWEGPEPLKRTIFGAEQIGPDLGYGPAQLNDPETVRAVAEAISALSAAEVLRRYSGRTIDKLEIYPGNFASDSSWRAELKDDLERLRGFYTAAAGSGDAVVTWIS
jgi:Domain of unknown function (DUF1877)